MSQEKVDRYKEQKANRDKIMRKQKQEVFLLKLAGSVIGLAFVCWIGYSTYRYINPITAKTYAIDTAAVQEFMTSLNETEAAEAEK